MEPASEEPRASARESVTTNETGQDNIQEQEEEILQKENARLLRTEFGEFMECIRRSYSHEIQLNNTELEEEFVLLISQYQDKCLQRAVLMTDYEDELMKRVRKYSVESKRLISETITSRHIPSDTLRLPIHLSCDNNAPVSIIRTLLEADVNNQSILKPDKWGDLPIHTACSRNNIDVIRLLLQADTEKRTLYIKDVHKSLPIHMAARYNAPKEILQLLIDNDKTKSTLYEEGIHGQCPLTVACRGNPTPDTIQTLLEYDKDKKSVLHKDDTERLPIHIYLLRNRNVQCVQFLLEGMLYGRIQRLGLEQWKYQCQHAIIEGMTSAYERDFATKDKLEIICHEIQQLYLQRAYVLELIIWKASCIRQLYQNTDECNQTRINLTSKSIKEILRIAEENFCKTPQGENTTFCHTDFKKECHVKSGAEIIIPGVLSFIEDEPIVKIINVFKSVGYVDNNNE